MIERSNYLELKMLNFTTPNTENKYSNYENKLSPQYSFDTPELEKFFESNRANILQMVEKEIFDYINNDDLCNDSDGMFPKKSFLTGEWYIRSVEFTEDTLFILTALVGTDLGYKDDYLGLEVVFDFDEEENELSVDGVNSEAL